MAQTNIRSNKHFINGSGRKNGYDRWRYVFTGYNKISGEERPFFIEYYLLNPTFSPKSIVFQSTSRYGDMQNIRSSYIMIKAGFLGKAAKQINSYFTADKMAVNKKQQSIYIGNCLMCEKELKGSLTVSEQAAASHPEYKSNAGSISWELKMEKNCSYGVGYAASWFFRIFNSLEMFWNIQGMKTQFTGSITVDGDEYIVSPETSAGYTDSYWGKGFPNPWVWLSGSNTISQITGRHLNNTSFAVSGCYSRLFKMKKKQRMIIYAIIEGNEYEFNFTHFWQGSKVSWQCIENGNNLHWLVSAQNRTNVLDIDIFCKSDEMLVKSYESASGIDGVIQMLSGATGYGEIRLYKKVGRNLETIEYARVKNASCEYGEIEKTIG